MCDFGPKIELLESNSCFPLQQKRQMTIEPTERQPRDEREKARKIVYILINRDGL